MKIWHIVLVMLMVMGCAPTSQTKVNLANVSAGVGAPQQQELIGAFREVFSQFQITYSVEKSFRYEGSNESAFITIIDQFYAEHPGFCPLKDAFFISPDPRGVYMTLTAAGRQVAAIIYDQRDKPRTTYVVLKGTTPALLEVDECDK